LVAALAGAGIHVTREDDHLRVRAEPGMSLAPYVADLRQHKPEILMTLLQDEIVASATAARDAFDRQHYDQLWVDWYALQNQESSE
jgi:TubC N-terminal docking domain